MINERELKRFVEAVFIKMGVEHEDAADAAQVLVKADLRGVDSHGVARLKGYVRLWENGLIDPKATLKIERETIGTATINGNSNFGLVIAPKAMKVAINKAKEAGTGWVTVKNSSHFGIAGYYSMLALEHDMIGLAFTNASPLVAPTFGKERMLGTNPIAVAFPSGKEQPVVIDMATTTVANGKLEVAKRKKEKIPIGWVQSDTGDLSENPKELEVGGSLTPLGSTLTNSSYKGYCLSSMVDILSGVLTGANFGPWVPPFVPFLANSDNPVGEGIGHFFGAIKIDAFMDVKSFKKRMDLWINTFKNSTPLYKEQEVLIPGEPEKKKEEVRIKNGIPLLDQVKKDLNEIAKKFNIEKQFT